MRTTKSIFGLVAAAIPVLYCGGFLLYFAGVGNSFGGLLDGALGPTMVGLGAVGLLFLIPLVLRIRRLAGGTGAPGAGGVGRPDKAPQDGPSDFDPDAAIARYLAQRPTGGRDPASPAPDGAGGPVRQAGFGRRGA